MRRLGQAWDRPQQRFGIGHAGVGEELGGGGLLHDAAGVHDDDLVGAVGHHTEVVGDEDHAHVTLALLVGQEVEDLGLHGDVEPCGGLVGEEELGPARQGDGDHDPLAHAARQLVGVIVQALLGGGDAHRREQRHGRVVGGLAVEPGPQAQGLGDLAPHPHDRVQRRHGVLEDQRHLHAPHLAQLGQRHGGEVVAREAHRPRALHVGPRDQAHDRTAEDGLARARLAHHPEGATPGQRQRHPVDGAYQAPRRPERRVQVDHLEQRPLDRSHVGEGELGPPAPRASHSFTSRRSKYDRNRSAMRLRAVSSKKM